MWTGPVWPKGTFEDTDRDFGVYFQKYKKHSALTFIRSTLNKHGSIVEKRNDRAARQQNNKP